MKRFVEGADRGQSTLLPECLDEWVEESNSVRVIDTFVDALDLADLGFVGVEPAATGRHVRPPITSGFAAAVQFCSDQAEKQGYDFWRPRSYQMQGREP
jgi:hypothetical protein